MKKLLVVTAMLALFASIGVAQEKQYDVPGVFSFTYGEGWSKGPRKGGSAKELEWLVNTAIPNASFTRCLPAPISPMMTGSGATSRLPPRTAYWFPKGTL